MGAHAVRLSNVDIDAALEAGDFEILFQPIFDLKTGSLARMETFVRWRHRTLGLLPPGAFISFFETQGRMSELTRYVLRNALDAYTGWRGPSAPGFSINLALSDLIDEAFANHFTVAMRDRAFPPELITFECPMPPVDADVAAAAHSYQRLKETGARLAIEVRGRANDFLKSSAPFPFDEIKTGGAAILRFARTVRGPGLSAISELLELAERHKAAITAVGVEDQASLIALRGIGFTAAQGNHLGRVGDLSAFTPSRVNDVRDLLGLPALSSEALAALFRVKSAAGEEAHAAPTTDRPMPAAELRRAALQEVARRQAAAAASAAPEDAAAARAGNAASQAEAPESGDAEKEDSEQEDSENSGAGGHDDLIDRLNARIARELGEPERAAAERDADAGEGDAATVGSGGNESASTAETILADKPNTRRGSRRKTRARGSAAKAPHWSQTQGGDADAEAVRTAGPAAQAEPAGDETEIAAEASGAEPAPSESQPSDAPQGRSAQEEPQSGEDDAAIPADSESASKDAGDGGLDQDAPTPSGDGHRAAHPEVSTAGAAERADEAGEAGSPAQPAEQDDAAQPIAGGETDAPEAKGEPQDKAEEAGEMKEDDGRPSIVGLARAAPDNTIGWDASEPPGRPPPAMPAPPATSLIAAKLSVRDAMAHFRPGVRIMTAAVNDAPAATPAPATPLAKDPSVSADAAARETAFWPWSDDADASDAGQAEPGKNEAPEPADAAHRDAAETAAVGESDVHAEEDADSSSDGMEIPAEGMREVDEEAALARRLRPSKAKAKPKGFLARTVIPYRKLRITHFWPKSWSRSDGEARREDEDAWE